MLSTASCNIIYELHPCVPEDDDAMISFSPRIQTSAIAVTLPVIPLQGLHVSSSRTLDAFCLTTRGLDCSSPPSSPLKPSTLPIIPGGFGTGHSCALFLILACSFSVICRDVSFSLAALELSSIRASVVRRRLLRLPSSIISISESANLTRGAGHGTMWGMPTTRKETMRVVPKREVVRRDRGWRWGVMLEGVDEVFNAENGSSCYCHCDGLGARYE